MKGDAAAWESVWRRSQPRHARVIVVGADARGDRSACMVGLMRSTYPERPPAALPNARADQGSERPESACLNEEAHEQIPEPEPAPFVPVPYNEFPPGF